jgi:hypothetical protein
MLSARRASRAGSFASSHIHRRGPCLRTGQGVVWDLLNIFRFDDQGRLVEEWVRTDYRSFLRQLATEAGDHLKRHARRSGQIRGCRGYFSGRAPKIRISTSLRALCCQSGLVDTFATPIRARRRSMGSRSFRMSPLLIARFTSARIAPQIWL